MQIFPPWYINDWETVDDRVRGGESISELCESGDGVVFSGTLDITALGGAGFASQRYRFPNGPLRIPSSNYSGIRIKLDPTICSPHAPNDFTLILTTAPIKHHPDGRVESRVNWEATFNDSRSSLEMPFSSFKATYRGRPVNPAPTLDTENVFDISIMCRSGFGAQAGTFQLGILSIEAISTSS